MIDIKEIPFSRRGSYFAVSYLAQHQAIFIRDVHGGDDSPSELFEIVLEGTSDVTSEAFQERYVIETTESLLKISRRSQPAHYLAIILPTAEQLRVKVVGMEVGLKAHKVRYDSLNQLSSRTYEYISYKKETKFHLRLTGSQIKVEAPWYRVGNPTIDIRLDGQQEPQELVIDNYQVVLPRERDLLPTFEEAHQIVEQEYREWEKSADVPQRYRQGQKLANYIIWSSIVRPVGQLTCESIYMSKNWMQNIWSWDNCFNAMAVAAEHPKLAFGQFQVFMDHQDKSGVYPDFINDQYVSYNCCKPPIHGWAYSQLMAVHPYFSQPAQLNAIYDSIAASTNFWLTYRMSDQGLPYYTHGNDSGWDNASIFHQGLPVISPDLSGYLIQQMDILGRWAKQLGRSDDSERWQHLADQLTEQLLKVLYDGDHFMARSYRTGEPIEESHSLLLCLPLVISYRLPETLVTGLIQRITTQFEGPFGLQTEATDSPHYQVDGYWLGPIWAPASFIFFDAFRRSGQKETAKRLAQKYCQLANDHGMAENYNPETGMGNDDLSFTWTSSVFLLLGNYLKELENG